MLCQVEIARSAYSLAAFKNRNVCSRLLMLRQVTLIHTHFCHAPERRPGSYLLSLPVFAGVPKALPKIKVVHAMTVTLVSSEGTRLNLLSKV
jgi:hypothetical protein